MPAGTVIGTELIRGAIGRAFAGVEGCAGWTGTHALRHTAATRLHRRGASLKELADLLGHQSIDTTAIYTNGRPAGLGFGRVALAGGTAMSATTPMVQLAEEYLDYRRRLGFQLRIKGQMPLEFARYADRVGHTGPLTTELAVRWARLSAGTAPLYQARRLEVVRCFARRRAIWDAATEVPPEGLLGPGRRRTDPH